MIPKKSSKELLIESAIELISLNSIEKVAVSDIARNCNVSTRTFYNHFQDKYDLINYAYIHMIEDYYNSYIDTIDFHSCLTYTAKCIYDNLIYFKNITKYSGQNNFKASVLDPLRSIYLRLIQDIYHDEINKTIYDSITFFLYGCIGYVDDVLRSQNIPTREESVEFFEKCLPTNLKKYLD